ncbi:hypothetical protein FOZ76_00635 [Verticiella sediminum]|uniref:Iron transporter n=1 Tax=Verticiella sediminum TaxID=1247510 RepID=A0A556B254_9BURK|nr:hypothetical protein [Verticiella sediminum]TSH99268.1 hypothetical protein FOZ76_00635 [Verticiella sediminum]
MIERKATARSNPSVRPDRQVRATASMARAGLSAHVVAVCLLAYLASARLVDATGVLLHRMGMTQGDAVVTASMAGFLYLWAMLMWAFSRRSVLRTWLCVGSLAGLAVLAAWMLGGKA